MKIGILTLPLHTNYVGNNNNLNKIVYVWNSRIYRK